MENSPKIQKNKVACDDNCLAKFRLFAELGTDELRTLLDLSTTASFAANQRIITNGEAGHCMYVILNGSARVSIQNSEGEVELAKLAPGDFFGEVSLVDDGPRSADVTTIEVCDVLCITRMTLGVLAGLQPGAAIHILASIGRSLVGRLRADNQKYLDLIMLSRPN